ncbi:Sulfate transporter family protein [Pleurostoma richardsiae]|uniref:Sulfate transporter family protein n=1 Tax=Pleurostoma richardsiae TaxID=41990 RepID=A0AA38S7Z1_9PEZI|nr:Sulfate transporter family protein [Pleurostoma richardsiae]
MASPSAGFSPWRRRASSLHSQANQDDTLSGAPSPLRTAPQNVTDPKLLSSSLSSANHREPIRSFIHGSVRDNLATLDSAQFARSVREDTAELASYILSDKSAARSPSFLARQRPPSSHLARDVSVSDSDLDDAETSTIARSEPIIEVAEPSAPEDFAVDDVEEGPSLIATMLRKSPPDTATSPPQTPKGSPTPRPQSMPPRLEEESKLIPRGRQRTVPDDLWEDDQTETAPLLRALSHSVSYTNGAARNVDLESQKSPRHKSWLKGVAGAVSHVKAKASDAGRTLCDQKTWAPRNIWEKVIKQPLLALPAVILGLILNILDALSYGMILFPLGSPVFAGLGPAGISIFYVSTIVSQVTFSCASIFKGGVGSELIEVVPFFHSMAGTITDIVGEDSPDAVIATTITSYALSAMLTGFVFFMMGKLKFGYLVGFIPRHILIGCIGGVGWFLIQTGFEVSARFEGGFNYDLDTLRKLIQPHTIPLWLIPLVLSIILYVLQRIRDSKYLLPLYICTEPVIFWFFVVVLDTLNPDTLRKAGWIFEAPPADEPWWFFWTLYRFDLVHWGAVAECIPAMLALTFFGVLHVPINVPALAMATGEDHADLDHELKLHGYTNFLSGCAGSIQNYLVYANSQFFIKSGGNSRLAGFMLAAFTAIILVIGPVIIGYIPVMMVGTLIFVLGFELFFEAVWQPRKKLKWLEYLTVIAIVLIMGIYDFVVGIGVGVLLAFVSLIFQSSRVSAVRATFTGEVVGSTVRRNPSQQHYLKKVGSQIYLIKLAGYLFFGTIVSVEEKIRALIDDEEFSRRPIKYLILDLWQVTGLDYSAGEAFNTTSRLLASKGIVLVLSGVNPEDGLGRDLRAVGLGAAPEDTEVRWFPNLNSALESCENELLKTFYASQEAVRAPSRTALDVPRLSSSSPSLDMLGSSPRRSHLQHAARESLTQTEVRRQTRWQNFKEPLRLMLQIFQDLSDKNEDFWVRAKDYFVRRELHEGDVLFRRGELAGGFYLVESGILRVEYNLPQGWLYESIVAGTTCGELPFFSETRRTATASAERDTVVWFMDRERWDRLQREQPDVAQELLRISLKLTSERMTSITSYILTMAG